MCNVCGKNCGKGAAVACEITTFVGIVNRQSSVNLRVIAGNGGENHVEPQ